MHWKLHSILQAKLRWSFLLKPFVPSFTYSVLQTLDSTSPCATYNISILPSHKIFVVIIIILKYKIKYTIYKSLKCKHVLYIKHKIWYVILSWLVTFLYMGMMIVHCNSICAYFNNTNLVRYGSKNVKKYTFKILQNCIRSKPTSSK
jgi:hypothetical protein